MSVKEYLIQEVKSKGWIPIDEFMNIALTQRPESYYTNNLVLGKAGDFITAPEISQLFGETIAIWVMFAWENLGKPKKFNLIELGPGRGTLIRDLLKSTEKFTEFQSAINQILFVECNQYLISLQKNLLSNFKFEFKWFENLYQISSDCPFILVANEFFDALPIKQYVKKLNRWYEIMVGVELADEIRFMERPLVELESTFLNIDYENLNDGDIVETSYESIKLIHHIYDQLTMVKGAALIIDYGYNRKEMSKTSFISSLQAIKSHTYHPILEDIGTTDLSAMVDFEKLIEILENNQCYNYTYSTQREFLLNYGIYLRFKKLLNALDQITQEALYSGYERLMNPQKMGNLYKALEICKY